MEKLLTFNISEILNTTPAYYAGHKLTEYASVYVATFFVPFRNYTINAIFDIESDDKRLVIADDETDVIVCKL